MFRALSLWQRDVSAATPLQAGSACVSISEVNHEHRLSLAAFSAKLASVLRRLRNLANVLGIADEPYELLHPDLRAALTEYYRVSDLGILVDSPARARAFVASVGYPVVAKPDIGVGANHTFKIVNDAELEAFLMSKPEGYLIEEYVHGVIQTFDGLTDRHGEPVFFTSMQYSDGVMEIVINDDDIFYLTERHIPPDLEQAGRRILALFDVRERFFHFEFFRTPEGRLVALEVNMRPPGGLTIDMFNYASNIDLYDAWAHVVLHQPWQAPPERPYHVCYAGRKPLRPYALTHAEIMARFGDRIVHHQPMPDLFHRAMGAYAYLIRSPDRQEALEIAQQIQRLNI
jgi:hypothetical protein